MIPCAFCSKPLSTLPRPYARAVLSVCEACMNPVVLRYDGARWEAAPPTGMQDIRQIAQEGAIGGELMRALPEAMERLPILPEIAHRVLALLRDPEMAMQDLIDLINQDQVIALKVLRLANSATYGGLTEIRDLRAACARLGMRVIANTVQAIANGRLYTTSNPKYADMMTRLWRHALASAQCANDITVLIAEPSADVSFVAGLIHDVGKVLLLDVLAHYQSPTLEALREAEDLVEEVIAGYHSLIGLHITRRWNLPPEFGVTTFCHDRIEAVPDDSWLPSVHTVGLASAMANACGYGTPDPNLSLLGLPSTKFLGLTDIKLAALRIDLEDRVAPLLEITG